MVAFGMATQPSGAPQTDKAAKYRRTAYFFHKALAVGVFINFVMALSAFHQSKDVVGGYVFMFVIVFGVPLLFLLCASLYYSFRARSDWHLVVLSAASFAMAALALLGIEPTLKSLVMDCAYVASVVYFSVFQGKRDREIRSRGFEGGTGDRQDVL
jgi:predicted neutral ceramidase superfamily lipid hydrolase